MFNKIKSIIMNKQNFMAKEWVGKALAYVQTLGRVTIVILAMFCGFVAGKMHYDYQNRMSNANIQKTSKLSETSVAINERGELMMINRNTGAYTLYQDSVGQMIFGLYTAKIYYGQNNAGK